MKTYRQLAAEICRQLAAVRIASPEAEARIIVESAAHDRFFNLTFREVSPSAEAQVREIIARRRQKEPLQYILKTATFRELDLLVTPDVLIPRPETELLAGFCIEALPPGGTLLDIGTGSGAIALSVASERSDIRVTAVDISDAALAVARQNGEKYHLLDRVEMMYSDLFSALENRRFDVIAANLPYVTPEEYPALDEEVKNFEPRLALVSPDAGLEHIKRTIGALDDHLNRNGSAFFELSPPQAEPVAALLTRAGWVSEIRPDLTRRPRFVMAKKQ